MKIYLVFVAIHLFVANCESAQSTNPDCDFSNPTLRIDGGYSEISQAECESRNNCFDDTIRESKWCFISKRRTQSVDCKFEKPESRVDGGHEHISKEECEAGGSCFDDTIPDVHWCFKKNTN